MILVFFINKFGLIFWSRLSIYSLPIPYNLLFHSLETVVLIYHYKRHRDQIFRSKTFTLEENIIRNRCSNLFEIARSSHLRKILFVNFHVTPHSCKFHNLLHTRRPRVFHFNKLLQHLIQDKF